MLQQRIDLTLRVAVHDPVVAIWLAVVGAAICPFERIREERPSRVTEASMSRA